MSNDGLIRLAGRGVRGRGASDRKVVLVDFYWTRDKDPRVPLGHASLLAALRRAGVTVESMAIAVNAGVDVDAVADRIVAHTGGASGAGDVDVAIGAYVWAERAVRGVLRGLRARGFAGRIIVGGPQISYAGAGLERLYPEADAFVRGYGEEALVALARAPGRPVIAGVHHAGDHDREAQATVDLEQLASPWLDGVVPLADQGFIRWETQRGCPFRCSFCQHSEPGKRLKHRTLDRGRIFDEIDLFCRAGVNDIAVLDPIFNTRDWAPAILARFAGHGFTGRLSLQCRAEMIDDDFLAATAGLHVRLELGLQTIHHDESKAVGRGNHLARIDQALAGIRAAGLDHEVSLIFGLPGQTLASFVASVRWCLERGVPTIKAFPLLLLRGTRLDRERAAWGYQDDGGPMAMVRASNSFSRADWEAMSRIAAALRATERRHPSIDEVLRLAPDMSPDHGTWQSPDGEGGDA